MSSTSSKAGIKNEQIVLYYYYWYILLPGRDYSHTEASNQDMMDYSHMKLVYTEFTRRMGKYM